MKKRMKKMLNPARGPCAETAALSLGCDPDLCALVCCLSAEPATSGGDDVGTRDLGGPFDGTPLGYEAAASAGESVSLRSLTERRSRAEEC
jgi:hypothetical protein